MRSHRSLNPQNSLQLVTVLFWTLGIYPGSARVGGADVLILVYSGTLVEAGCAGLGAWRPEEAQEARQRQQRLRMGKM